MSGQPMMFAHGFGCDQNMWRHVAPAFADEYRIVLFDQVGPGDSDHAAYSRAKYGSLRRYAEDVLEICRELELRDLIFVGHSVSAMIGVLAAVEEPERFAKLVLVGPRRGTSTTATTSAGSLGRTSRDCSSRSTATISAGRRRWRPRSSEPSSQTSSKRS
jgi:pimeloyl-ACP methyl ester carboxylesterase